MRAFVTVDAHGLSAVSRCGRFVCLGCLGLGSAQAPVEALNALVAHGLVAADGQSVAITELGALTSRLMVEVDAAGAMLPALANAGTPVVRVLRRHRVVATRV